MALRKQEFEAFVEREGLMDFIWARSWKDIEGSEIGLFEMANDRWGCVFQIFPSVYAGQEAENRLSNFFNSIDIPDKSSIQFFSFASRNLTPYMEAYSELHSNPGEVEYKEALVELKNNRLDWIRRHSNENIFSKGNDLRLRNFVNLVCVTIPKTKKAGIDFSEAELVSYFSRVQQGLTEFNPKKFTSRQWVTVMREILIPDNPLWFPPDDNKNELNYQVVNNNSIMTLEDEAMGIGTMISKEEHKKLMEEQNLMNDNSEEDEEELTFFQKIFSKKKKKSQDLEAYTRWKAKTFTTKMFPYSVSMAETASKFYDYLGERMSPTVPCPFMLSLIIYFENREKLKKEVGDKIQWNMWQTQSLGEAARYFPEIVERAKEAENVNLMLHNGSSPMYASWSCTLMDHSITNVNKYSEALKNEFMRSNWILQEEVLIPHWIFIYHLPLNFEPYVLNDLAKRMNTLFSSNCAAITPLVTGDKGYGAPILTYVDRGGQLSGVDIFASGTNYNFIVVGSSGSGKSYSMSDFFSNYLMAGAKIRVIDVGRSYLEFCTAIGGQYIEFTEEASMCLNFFTNIQTNEKGDVHEDELQTIVPLVGLMAMQAIDSDEADNIEIPVIKGVISQAITRAFKSRQRNAGMQDVVEAMEQIALEKKNETGDNDTLILNLISALYPFGHVDGEYYKYFNGDNNLKFRSDFVVLELEELDSKSHLKSVVLASIAHAINTEFFLGSRKQKKILAIDEAWSIMDNRIVVKFLETMARRIRKYNGASGIITQTIADFYKSKATRAIFDSSAWKFFLQQSKESIAAASGKGELTMDKVLITLLETVKTKPPYYSEVLVKQDSGAFFVGRLITDPVAHWIYTNHPKDMVLINQIMDEFSVNSLDARLIKGYSMKHTTTYEEEYLNRLNDGKLAVS